MLGYLASIHQCAHWVRCAACELSLTTWLLFSGVLTRRGLLRVRCPGSLGSCAPVCPLGVLCCVCGVPGHFAPIHLVCSLHVLCCMRGVLGPLARVLRCDRSALCVACVVSSASWLLFTGVLARCVVLCVVCAVSWASWLLFAGVGAGGVVLRVWGVAAGRAVVHPDGGYT